MSSSGLLGNVVVLCYRLFYQGLGAGTCRLLWETLSVASMHSKSAVAERENMHDDDEHAMS